jgi:stress-induced morphogen
MIAKRPFSSAPIRQMIITKITSVLLPVHLEVTDESHLHAGHQAMKGKEAQETHFKVVVYSKFFDGKPLIERHRLVNSILEQELRQGVHALSITAKPASQFN